MLHLKIVMCELFNSPASASEAGKVTFSIPTFFSLFFDTLFIGQGGGGIEQILSSKKYKQAPEGASNKRWWNANKGGANKIKWLTAPYLVYKPEMKG